MTIFGSTFLFFVFLSWHGVKDRFFTLTKVRWQSHESLNAKIEDLTSSIQGRGSARAVTGRIGWWKRSFSCRLARTSKSVYFRKITRPHLITVRAMKNKNLEWNSVRHRRTRKPKTTCRKKGKYAPSCWNQLRCRCTMQLGGRGTQKLAAKSLQTNITLEI